MLHFYVSFVAVSFTVQQTNRPWNFRLGVPLPARATVFGKGPHARLPLLTKPSSDMCEREVTETILALMSPGLTRSTSGVGELKHPD